MRVIHTPEGLRAFVSFLEPKLRDGPLVFHVKPWKPTGTNQQLKKIHAMCADFAHAFRYHQRFRDWDHRRWREFLRCLMYNQEGVTWGDIVVYVDDGPRVESMNIAERNRFIEFIYQQGAEFGVIWRDEEQREA